MVMSARGARQKHDFQEIKLYLITDRQQTGGRPLADVILAALQGGVKAVQLREKDLPDGELLELARNLRMMTHEFGARLLINRRVDICLAVGADGVHLGSDGQTIAGARRALPAGALIGYSAHDVEEACAAERAGASFVTFGPVFATPSKVVYGAPVGLDRLEKACSRLSIPVLALGGIKQGNIGQVMARGAHGVALISAVIAASEPTEEARKLLSMIETEIGASHQ